MTYCDYGCGNSAIYFQFASRKIPNGRYMCGTHARQCPVHRAKTTGKLNGMSTIPEAKKEIGKKNSKHQAKGAPARLKREQTCLAKYGKKHNFSVDSVIEQITKHRIKIGHIKIPFEQKSLFDQYEITVDKLTKKTYKNYKTLINPLNLKRGITNSDYQLDHIVSITEGFNLGLDPEIIAHPANLRMLTSTENKSKNSKSHYTKEQLLEAIKQFTEST